MSRDPVDRVLEHYMQHQTTSRPYDPILNPNPGAQPVTIKPHDPNAIFDDKDFGRPATGDGK
jgi:hypothetical protein